MWPFSHAKLKMLGNETRETSQCRFFSFCPLRTCAGEPFSTISLARSFRRLASDFFAPNTHTCDWSSSIANGKETVGKGHLNNLTKAHPNNCISKRTVRSHNSAASPLPLRGCGGTGPHYTKIWQTHAQTHQGEWTYFEYMIIYAGQISFTAENDCLFNEHTAQVQPFRNGVFPTHTCDCCVIWFMYFRKKRRRFISNGISRANGVG